MVSRFWPTIILSATFINLINLHSWLVKNMAHWELPIDPYEINLVFRAITSFFSMSFFPRAKSCIKLDCLGLGVCVESRDRDKEGQREWDLACIPFPAAAPLHGTPIPLAQGRGWVGIWLESSHTFSQILYSWAEKVTRDKSSTLEDV